MYRYGSLIICVSKGRTIDIEQRGTVNAAKKANRRTRYPTCQRMPAKDENCSFRTVGE